MIRLAEEFKRLLKMRAILKEIEFDKNYAHESEYTQFFKDCTVFDETLTELDALFVNQEVVKRKYK